jgi:hypothetical protein
MLTAADLAYTRQTQSLTLVERAILQHRESIDDGMGNWVDVVTGYTPDIPCRVAPLRVQAAESVIGGQLQGGLPWNVTLPAGTAVDLTDRVNVGGTLSGTAPDETVDGGRWFEVIAIYAQWTNESARQCLCIER